MIYTCLVVKTPQNLENDYLVGDELGNITRFHRDNATNTQVDVFHGHTSGIRGLDLNKSGTRLLTSCMDHTIRIWDYESAKPLAIFAGHHDSVVSV